MEHTEYIIFVQGFSCLALYARLRIALRFSSLYLSSDELLGLFETQLPSLEDGRIMAIKTNKN